MPYKHDYDRAMRRIYEIFQRAYDGETINIKELAVEFGVSEKTIQRDIHQRTSLGRIMERTKGGFVLTKKSALTSPQDAVTLEILEKLSESLGHDFSIRAKSLLTKLKEQLDSTIFTKMQMEDIGTHMHIISELDTAIKNCFEIAFSYKLGRKNIEVHAKPHKIASFDGFWYLIATDTNEGIIKKYHIKSITGVQTTNTKFKTSKKLQEHLENAINIWFSPNAKAYTARLWVSREIYKYFERKPLSKSQSVMPDMGDYILEVKITDDYEIIPEIMKWIPFIRPLEPQTLADEVERRIAQYLDFTSHP
ncbi:MAG: WYL domain-containing protein [Campylobacterales bacterium]|nr:WYL domain-containing protein [Campylobacterales bacterium]